LDQILSVLKIKWFLKGFIKGAEELFYLGGFVRKVELEIELVALFKVLINV
jgi:hypothetical protein